ncbi:MAG: hypothetical protein EZS28_033788 [Streblomastix strix]|uniref:Uncharacterized protein n=1 Tax=Streblomastix strix TaxID=222440 RepID=A0A5J4UKD8_9EUKA|nr:MAG: hypothetical protein EZS28_033788 [Streblomastix strix]
MNSEQEIQNAAIAIISFTNSDTKNKQEIQNEQSDSEQTPSLTDIVSCLESLKEQIQMNRSSNQVVQIPKLLQSLIALVTFRLGTHLREQTDLLSLAVRHWNRLIGEERDKEIYIGLFYIYRCIRALHEGRNYPQPSFQPLPLLDRRTVEQMEEEGAIEEIEAQVSSNGLGGRIKFWAINAKAVTLNCFIHRSRI